MGVEIKQGTVGGKTEDIGNLFKYYLVICAIIFVYAILLVTVILPRIEDQQTRLLLLAITYVLYIIVLAIVIIVYYNNKQSIVKTNKAILRTGSIPKANVVTKAPSVNIVKSENIVPELAGPQYTLDFILNDDNSNAIDELFNPQKLIITHDIFKSNVNNKDELIDKAFAEYMQAIGQNPQDYLAHNNLGNIYVYKNMLDEAVKEYLEAVKIKPNSYRTLSNLGAACYQSQKYDDAVIVLKESIKIKPDYAPAHNNLGLVQLDRLAFDEAVWEFQTAVKYDPTSKEAKNNLDRSLKIKKANLHEGVTGSLP